MSERNDSLSPEQISDARKLGAIIASVPNDKRLIFGVVMLAYFSGLEAGAAYAKDAAKTTN